MHSHPKAQRGFSLLELIMAMALFSIAAIALAQALNTISVTVGESIDFAELREKMRAVLLEVTRDPNIEPDSRETNPDEDGVYFRIVIQRLDAQNIEGSTVADIFDVKVMALRTGVQGRTEELDSAQTWVYPRIF